MTPKNCCFNEPVKWKLGMTHICPNCGKLWKAKIVAIKGKSVNGWEWNAGKDK